MFPLRIIYPCGLAVVTVVLTGCSGMSVRVRDAVTVAASDPWSWAPLAGAAAIGAAQADERISRWARTETPLFGSEQAALRASDRYRGLAGSSAWLTFLAARPPSEGDWAEEKSLDAGGNLLGLAVARNTTGILKHATQRERPHNGPVRDSFPSAHATDAFAHATMGRYYATATPLGDPGNRILTFGMNSFAIATAWARVEGGVHYPTDVLAGAAIANFATRFFLELNRPNSATGWRMRSRQSGNGEIIIGIEKPL